MLHNLMSKTENPSVKTPKDRLNILKMVLLLEGMLNDIRFVFKCAGLSLDCRKKSVKDTIKRRFIFILNSLMVNSDIIMSVCWFVNGLGNGTSFAELSFIFPCFTFGTIASIKTICLVIKEDLIIEIIEDMNALEAKRLDKINNATEKVINKEAKFLKVIIKLFYRSHCLNVAFFIVSPVILIVIKYMQVGELELRLPLLDFYPFDGSSIIYWLVKYMKQICSVCVVVVDICAADFLFFTCCTYLRMQYLLLQHNFQELIPKNISNDILRYNENIWSKFLELIRWHQNLISTSEKLESVFTQSTLVNFIISSFVICLTGFNVMTIKDILFVLTFTSFLFLCLLQVFFLCYFGDLLMTSSIELSDSIYNCRWYLMDCSFRKNMIIVLTRSQRACKLTAWGYANINLNAFMRVLSTSWSYLALLNTMYDQLS